MILKYFEYNHLPKHLKKISKPFRELAYFICDNIPDNEEQDMALRKLLEAKDCAVRALVAKEDS